MGAKEDLARLEEKVDWLVRAVKHLLAEEINVQAELEGYEEFDFADEAGQEWIAPRFAPKPKTPPPCPHNQQVLVDGNVTCARCGTVLTSSGTVKSSLSPSGQVIPDPTPPKWATEHSPGASSKNPGTPLVPHTV